VAEKQLTDTRVKNAKAKGKLYYLTDGGGLRLRVRTTGVKTWLFRFRIGGAENTVSLGPYPDISLAGARKKAAEYRGLLLVGKSPARQKKKEKQQRAAIELDTFGAVRREWIKVNQSTWSQSHLERNTGLLRRVLSELENIPIAELTDRDLLPALRAYYENGAKESARRARQIASQIFVFARETRGIKTNPALLLADSPYLKKPQVTNFSALPKKQVGDLMAALRREGKTQKLDIKTRCALLLLLYTGLRDGSLRGASWGEIDLKDKIWNIPSERMKRRRPHAVPLPTQAVDILNTLHDHTFSSDASYIFASNTKTGFMAENTLRLGLHRLGFKVTAHGMRSLITDVLNEEEFSRDAIERQLDHVERNNVRSAYLRTDFMNKRREMMQWFANWSDEQERAMACVSSMQVKS